MDIHADASMFGGQVGAAEQRFGHDLATVGQNLGDIALFQQERTNQVASNDAYNKLQEGYFNLTYGDRNKPNDRGFYGMNGQDAMTAYKPTSDNVLQLRQQLSDSLPNDAARLKFEQDSRRLANFTLEQMGRHYDSQFNAYTKTVNDATQRNSLQAITADYNDDGKYQQHLDMMLKAAVQSVQDAYGMNASHELIDHAVNEATTKAVVNRAEAWGVNDPGAALEWLKTQQPKIDATHYQTLYNHLEGKANGAADDGYISGLLGGLPGGSRSRGGSSASLSEIHPSLTTIRAPGGAGLTVSTDAAPKFQGLVNDLEAEGYKLDPDTTGGYNPRNIAGTNTPSEHAYGRAIDVNWKRNPKGGQSDIPPELARRLAAKWGLTWGGDWQGADRDPMHFEIAQGGGTDHPSGGATGWKANNPLNITGEGGVVTPKGTRLASYDSMPEGVAATAAKLKMYQDERGLDTVRKMYTEWHSGDAVNEADMAGIAKALGVGLDQPFTLDAGKAAAWIRQAQPSETGTAGKRLSEADLAAGIAQFDRGGGTPRLTTVGGQTGTTPDGTPVVQARAGQQQPDQTQGATYPDRSALVQQVIRDNPDPARRAARLSKLENQLSVLRIATETERNDLTHSLPDLQAAALDGKDITIPEANIRRLLPPADAARTIEALQVAQHAGLVLKGVQWSSPENVQAAWQDLSSGMGPISTMIKHGGKETMGPAAAAEAGSDQEGPEAYRMRQAILGKFEAMIGKRQQILAKDAAAYASSSPTVAAAAAAVTAAGNDMAKAGPAIQAYVNATLTVQEHLGVPASAQHVLPEAQARGLAGQIETAGNVQQSLRQMQQEWGDAWPKVFADLVTLGKLPGAYQSVAALDDPREAALLARSIAETSKGGKDWNDILGNAGGKPVAQGIRDAVRNDTTVMALERSLSRSGSTAQQIDGILSSIETLAYGKRFYNQDSNAAQSAIKAFTDRYTFLPSGARVPTERNDAVKANAEDLIRALTTSQIKVPEMFASTQDDRTKMPSAATGDDYLHSLKANPTWITSPREDALWLMDGAGRVVRGPDGKPINVPFSKDAPAGARLRMGSGALAPGLAVP